MSKLNNVVKNDVVRKDVYDKLVTKVNKINTSDFVLKTDYDTDESELENKTPDISNLVNKTNYNTKITETENKLNNHNHDKYITIPEFNTLAADVFNARQAQANLMLSCRVLTEKLLKIKQSIYVLKMN